MNRQLLYRNISFQTAYQILSNLLGFLFTVILIKSTTQFEFGAYSYIFSTLVIVNLFLELGIPTYFLRHWSTHPEGFEKESKLVLGTRILLALPVSILLFLYVFGIDRFVSLEFLLAYVYFLLDGYVQINKMYLSSQDNFHWTASIDAVEKILAYGGAMIALTLGGKLGSVFAIFIVSRIVAVFLSSYFTKTVVFPSFDVGKSLKLLGQSIPLFLLSVFGILYFRIDMLMIRYVLGIEAVAPYSTAYRLMDAAVLFPGIFLAVAVPTLTRFHAAQSTELLQKTIALAVKYLGIIALLFAAGCIVYGEDVLRVLFSSTYSQAYSILVIFGITTIFLYLNAPLSYFLYTNHKENVHTKILMLLTIVNIVANLLFLPVFGTVGAAFSTLVCEILAFFLMRPHVSVRVPLEYLWMPLACIILSSLLTLLVHPVWYVGCVFLSAVYVLLLFITRTLQIKNIRALDV